MRNIKRLEESGESLICLLYTSLKEIPFARLNGHPSQRLSNNANFAFQFIEGESMLIMLDMEGICGSSGSACTSGSLDPSHVLLAIGLPHEIAHGSLRLTLSAETTMEQIDFTVDCLKTVSYTHLDVYKRQVCWRELYYLHSSQRWQAACLPARPYFGHWRVAI